MRKFVARVLGFFGATLLLVPDLVRAAGEAAPPLINVADTRKVDWAGTKFFLDLYNTDPIMFAVWCTILTTFMGVGLGVLTDQIMKRTGIDLSSRKIVEH
jgi:hypothetical protein